MKRLLKSVLKTVLPDREFTRIMSRRSRDHQLQYLNQTGDHEFARKLIAAYGTSVLHGPFQGLIYPEHSLLERIGAPRLLGSYEQELHPIFENLSPSYDLYIDVGAAEGYYAIGMARKSAGGKVYAYETDPREAALGNEMARLNGVQHKVEFRSWCDENQLVALCANRRCFIVSDCEGYEFDLFGSRAVDALRRSDLIIELHERVGFVSRDEISQRFAPTHHLQVISVEPRSLESYPEAKILGTDAERALGDHRPPDQQWLHCRARS